MYRPPVLDKFREDYDKVVEKVTGKKKNLYFSKPQFNQIVKQLNIIKDHKGNVDEHIESIYDSIRADKQLTHPEALRYLEDLKKKQYCKENNFLYH